MRRQSETGRARAAGWLARSFGLCWFGLGTAYASPPEQQEDVAAVEEPPPAKAPTTAREWYDHGIELGNSGDFVGAAQAFLRSYELQPTGEALYNAGFAYRQAGDAIAAIEQYRRFLAEPERNEQLALAAEDAIAELMQEVGVLKGVRYAPSRPPAELYIAGQRRELDELPILLTPGPVIVEVVDEQGVRARETYEIAAGEALVVDLRALLPPAPEPIDDNVEIEPGPSPEQLEAARVHALRAKQLRVATWIGVALTGAAGVSLGTMAGLAGRERNAYLDATCFEFGGGDCPDDFVPGDPEAHFDAYLRHRLGARISAGLVGGLAVGTLVVGLVSLRLERKAARERARVRLVPMPGGLALEF